MSENGTKKKNRILALLRFLVLSALVWAAIFARAAIPSGELRAASSPFATLHSGHRSAVVLIHGWNPVNDANMFAGSEWPGLIDALRGRLSFSSWTVQVYDWSQDAATGSVFPFDDDSAYANATQAARNGFANGAKLADDIKSKSPHLRRLSLVAHSAGSWVALRAANRLLSEMPFLTVNVVLLDPFVPGAKSGDSSGLNVALMSGLASHASRERIYRLENYFAVDASDTIFELTSQSFSWSDNNRHEPHINRRVDYESIGTLFFGCSWPGNRIFRGHGGPIAFYEETVRASTSPYDFSRCLTLRAGDPQEFGFFRGLVEEEDLLPRITAEPRGLIEVGNEARLTVAANGAASYRWFKLPPGQPETAWQTEASCEGKTDCRPSLPVSGTRYVVRVGNDYGYTFSENTTLWISPPRIDDVTPRPLVALSSSTQRITLTGAGFTSGSRLGFRDVLGARTSGAVPIFDNPTQLRYDLGTGLAAGTWAVSVTTDGKESDWYPFYVQQSVTTLPGTPVVPNASDGTSATKVVIHWLAVAGGQTYEVNRCTTSSTATCVALPRTQGTTLDDVNGAPGVVYLYRVKACNAAGCGELSGFDTGFRGAGSAPASPANVTASDGTYPSGVLVYWPEVSGANTYQVYRATSLTGSKTTLTSSFRYTTYADVSVVAGRTYFYWIKACNYAGACSDFGNPDTGFSSTGSVATLSAAISPDPPNGGTGASIRVDLAWANGGGATSYDVYFGTDPTPDSSEFSRTTTATQAGIPDLEYSTTYYWRIDSKAGGQVVQGPTWQFTTRAESAGEMPNRATNPSPVNGARPVPRSTTLTWSNGGGATSYDVYFGRNFEPSAAEFVGNTAATSWTPPLLDYGKNYYWRIKAKNSAGTAHGDIWKFTVEPPAPQPASSPYPAHLATDMSPTSLRLYWNDTSNNATTFDVYFGTDPTPDASEFVGTTTQENWQVPDLQAGTTYYWQVVGRNNAGSGAGPVWSFSTWSTSPGILEVTPGGMGMWGPPGGPFHGASRSYTLKNVGEQPLDFTASKTHPWLQLSQAGGTLQPGQQTTIVASLTSAAASLSEGQYSDTIFFTNATNIRGSGERALSLAVGHRPKAWPIAQIAMGLSTVLILKDDGSLHGWGRNQRSELSLGSPAQPSSPAVIPIGTRSDWASIAMGADFTLAITNDGRLYSWGMNNVGQLGVGDTTLRSTATRVGTDTDWVQVSAGYGHSLALKRDGRLFGFGSNNDGQLGLGDQTHRSAPTQIGTATDWASVHTRYYNTVAIKQDGRMFTWGSDAGADGRNVLSPVQVGTFADWRVASGGEGFWLALRRNGSLYAWGGNSSGQLGLGDTANRNTPVQVGTDTDWVGIDAGGIHSLAFKTDGRLYAWGKNVSGQLGLGDKTDRNVPTLVFQDPSLNAVFANHGASFALLNDGSLLAWGQNFDGALGLGYSWQGNVLHVPTPTAVDLDWALVHAVSGVPSPSPGGSVSCVPSVVGQSGASVCVATANPGYQFAGFSGDCAGGTCSLNAITSDRNVAATFSRATFLLSLSRAGSGVGTIASNPAGITCGSTCSAAFDASEMVTLEAVAGAGSVFAGWSGACSGTGSCTVELNASKSVTATFVAKLSPGVALSSSVNPSLPGQAVTFTATVSGTGATPSGTVTFKDGAATLCLSVPLSASRATCLAPSLGAGSHSISGEYSGDVTYVAGNPGTLTQTVQASPTAFSLTVSKSGSGTGVVTSSPAGIDCGATCSGNFAAGGSVTLTATPSAGSLFTGWSGGGCGGTGPCTVALSAATTVTATFQSAFSGELRIRYRLYSPGTFEHLYTTDFNEYSVLPVCCAWVPEGSIYRIFGGAGSLSGVAAVPYYRLYNPFSHQHHWTIDANEYNFLPSVGWVQEGIDGYVLPTAVAGALPLYRLYLNAAGGLHLWTIDANERAYLIANAGWVDEGIAGYVIPLP